jgi:hypothetical protein
MQLLGTLKLRRISHSGFFQRNCSICWIISFNLNHLRQFECNASRQSAPFCVKENLISYLLEPIDRVYDICGCHDTDSVFPHPWLLLSPSWVPVFWTECGKQSSFHAIHFIRACYARDLSLLIYFTILWKWLCTTCEVCQKSENKNQDVKQLRPAIWKVEVFWNDFLTISHMLRNKFVFSKSLLLETHSKYDRTMSYWLENDRPVDDRCWFKESVYNQIYIQKVCLKNQK